MTYRTSRNVWLAVLAAAALTSCTTHHATEQASDAAHTLRIALVTEPTTLDPANPPDLVTSEMLAHVFEGLVRYDAQNRVAACLAERWDISPDGKTYTFHIRPAVKFHNGRTLTAADFKYSWQRALAPATKSNVAANYLDGILGVKDVVAGRRTDLPGVIAKDPLTLQVTIDRPRSFFLGMLSYPSCDAVCREAVEQAGGVVGPNSMIGTGPFRFESYQPGRMVSLRANADYWGGKPPVDRIQEIVSIEPETTYNNFRTGALDMWTSQLPFSRYAQDRDSHTLQDSYHLLPLAQVDYLAMNPAREPVFASADVRRALALAIDRDEIVRVAFQSVCQRADGFLPKSLPGGGPSPRSTPYDPAQARDLLAKAGYAGGRGFPTLTLVTLEKTPFWQATCQIVRKNLHDNLNITVNLQDREAGQFWADESKRALGFWLTGWVADYPDPQDFLSTLLVTNAPLNRVNYSDPKFDALCHRADMETDPARRAELYGQANQVVMDDLPVIPIVYEPRPVLIQPNVTGWQSNLCDFLPDLHTVKGVK